ncbi:MAG: bifunctional nicotinamidase/pyrazinamidase [Candidatus Heimdallarchaeota archaeon]
MDIDKIAYSDKISLLDTDALIVVDMQNDFIPGGALAVPGGDEIVHGVNNLTKMFFETNHHVILTQDWHPPNHGSFASVHPGKNPFDEYTEEEGLGPVLWPDHCVQGSAGAQFHTDLETRFAHLIIRKGFHQKIDSYSTFLENDKKTETGLDGYLQTVGVKRIFICGLALEYCDFFSARDAIEKGYEVVFVVDLTRGIDVPEGSVAEALAAMTNLGVQFAKSKDITIE